MANAEEPMPKQLTRRHAVKTATLQVSFDKVHCRDLDQLLQGAGDKARLRGDRRQSDIELKTLPRRDPLIRRLFSRDEIADERLVVRAALARAAQNVTPERFRTLGSPGRLARLELMHASGLGLDRDIRAGQVRKAAAMLARDRKKRSVIDSPVKARSAWLVKKGANTLASADDVRRVQLRNFCADTAARSSLAALLADGGDSSAEIAASISIFQAEAIIFIVRDMAGGKPGPQALMDQPGKTADCLLLRLFISTWRRAKAAGKVSKSVFPWFEAVDWLVARLHGARPISPGATRAPKSPRVLSPVATLRRARAAPAPPVRRPQNGRQSISLRMLNQLQSPTRMADTPALQARAVRPVTRGAAPTEPADKPARQATVVRRITRDDAPTVKAPATAIAAPTVPTTQLAPTASLLDTLLEYFASQNPGSSDGAGDEDQQPGSPDGDASPDKVQ
jgi:hypothetical protein